jgi:transcriptional regulator with XRE-family HTH domain
MIPGKEAISVFMVFLRGPEMKMQSEHASKSKLAPAEIRAAREAAGLTQTAAGELLHTTCRAWQQWEAGDRRMHPAMWELFCIKTAKAPVPPPHETMALSPLIFHEYSRLLRAERARTRERQRAWRENRKKLQQGEHGVEQAQAFARPARAHYDRAIADDDQIINILRSMPDACVEKKIQKLVDTVRAQGFRTSMARVERLIPDAMARAKK